MILGSLVVVRLLVVGAIVGKVLWSVRGAVVVKHALNPGLHEEKLIEQSDGAGKNNNSLVHITLSFPQQFKHFLN